MKSLHGLKDGEGAFILTSTLIHHLCGRGHGSFCTGNSHLERDEQGCEFMHSALEDDLERSLTMVSRRDDSPC